MPWVWQSARFTRSRGSRSSETLRTPSRPAGRCPYERNHHTWCQGGKCRLTLPSRGRPTSGFACCRPPLMSNVRALAVASSTQQRIAGFLFGCIFLLVVPAALLGPAIFGSVSFAALPSWAAAISIVSATLGAWHIATALLALEEDLE